MRALELWDGLPVRRLAREWGVEHVDAFDTVPSTNDCAWELLSQDCAIPAVVVADTQHAGRGRRGRAWSSPEGGLWLSVLIGSRRPSPVLPLRVGLAVVDSILTCTSRVGRIPSVGLKWPNDVLVGEQKVAGILCESREHHTVVGIGINVTQNGFDGTLQHSATSLAMALTAGLPDPPAAELPRRSALAGRVLKDCRRWPGPGELDPGEVARMNDLDALCGRRLCADGGARGTGMGIRADGAYIITTESGAAVELRTGGIQLEGQPS